MTFSINMESHKIPWFQTTQQLSNFTGSEGARPLVLIPWFPPTTIHIIPATSRREVDIDQPEATLHVQPSMAISGTQTGDTVPDKSI